MMHVWMNDDLLEIPEALSLTEVLTTVAQVKGTYAVALNQCFVPQHAYADTRLQAGDRIDIVTPMQGG